MSTPNDSTFCWKRVTVPKGLPGILEILAKETIRENPSNTVEFLSTLLDDLIGKICIIDTCIINTCLNNCFVIASHYMTIKYIHCDQMWSK